MTAEISGQPLDLAPQVLELVRFTGGVFIRSRFSEPWAYTAPPTLSVDGVLPAGEGGLVVFHIVAEGRCNLVLDDGSTQEMVAGDVLVMPYGDAHAMSSPSPGEPVSITTLLPPAPWTEFPEIVHGGDGDTTRIICGYLRGDALLFDPVLRALPSMFVVRPSGPQAAFVQASFEYALSATEPATAVGSNATDPRLMELLFGEALRIYLRDSDASLTGWLAALRDPVVGRALALLHAEPAREWTVPDLARAVAVSRTVLVDRFNEMLGVPPIRYLTEWRLNLAAGLLRTTDLTVAQIAGRVGYGAEDAFSRAFKRRFGAAPAHWRADAA
jgi:AraC-like DNA-binding protein